MAGEEGRNGESETTTEERGSKLRAFLLDWGLTLGLPVVIVLFLHAFVAEAFVVPTGSMLNTIQLDDRVYAEKVSYVTRTPEPGEIVLFRKPDEPDVILLKRVIATEGQTVDLVDGAVYVDGIPLDEPYTDGRPTYPLQSSADGNGSITYPFVVPEGHLWLMGDNRTNSRDSRYYGAIPASSVVARAFCIYWPLSHATLL